jgi:hypothetical protein
MQNSLLWLLADPQKLLDYMLAVFVLTELTKAPLDKLAERFKLELPTRFLAWFWSLVTLVVWEVVGVPVTAQLLYALLLGSAILCLATFASWDFLAKRFAGYFENLWAGDATGTPGKPDTTDNENTATPN